MRGSPFLLAAGLALTVASSCGGNADSASESSSITAVTTTTQVGDFARAVGGDRVSVKQILPPNADPHDYEPRPSDILAIGDTAVAFVSGGDLDEPLGELIEGAEGDPKVVQLIDSVTAIEDGDPHWWHDPRNVIRAVATVRDELIAADPAGRDGYADNAATYIDDLERLDRSIARCIERIPQEQRKLVTTHDALGYYADRYGLEVVGALIPSLSSQAQPSAKDTNDLVEQIERLDVRAIFPESSLNPKLEEAVARETGAQVGEALYADTLGPDGSPGATYLGSMEANTEAIAAGLGGPSVKCGF